MAAVTALFDANILASMTLTDPIIECARRGLIAARWSDDIHSEWANVLRRTRPDIGEEKIAKRRAAMDRYARDAIVSDYAGLAATLTLPAVKDRHVLAAAIVGGCSVIVTFNLKDFPASHLLPYGLVAVHPDDFFVDLLTRDVDLFVTCIATARKRLKNPPVTVNQYIDQLRKLRLPRFAEALEPYLSAI